VQDDLALVRRAAMLEDIDPLPRTKYHPHWNEGEFEKFIPRLYMKWEKSKSMKAPGYAR
jgi:hypothetical protein